MIYHRQQVQAVAMRPGLQRKTMATTEKLMLAEFSAEAGTVVPVHTHPNEQVGYVVRGQVKMTIAGVDYELEAGDSYAIPAGVPHGAVFLTQAVVVDVFTPPREDYR